MFHQIEGLVVDEGITMGDLKGALETLIKRLYGEDAVVRFRPHHFPFTEPSCEVDMQCFKCHGTGETAGQVCSTCHGEVGSSCWAPVWCTRRCSRLRH